MFNHIGIIIVYSYSQKTFRHVNLIENIYAYARMHKYASDIKSENEWNFEC